VAIVSAEPDIDAWVPRASVRTSRRRAVACAPHVLWATARTVRLRDTRTLGRLVAWRIPDTSLDQTFDALFRAYPFTVLDEGDRHLVAGLCGRIWTLSRDYPQLAGPDAFRAWREPDTVRVVFGHWVVPHGDGHAELRTEARIEPVDRAAGLRVKALWALIGHFEPLIASEPLSLAARRATGG
jgi:hypothetical protein